MWRANDRPSAREAAPKPECGLLGTPSDFAETTDAKNPAGCAGVSMPTCSQPTLAKDEPLPRRYFDHPLGGEWSDHSDFHIRPRLIRIYRKLDDASLELVRLGSHSEPGGRARERSMVVMRGPLSASLS